VRASAVERPELLFFYLGIVLGGVGALLGGLVAVALESRSHSARRSSP
jgi:ABC-type lipoprotein release transport system permease subunit